MNYWDENVINPIKGHFSKIHELKGLEPQYILSILNNCYDADTQEYILKKLDSIYRGYCLGEWRDYWLQDIVKRLMQFDQVAGKVIPTLDLIETAASWAKHSDSVRVGDFIELLTVYDLSIGHKYWDSLEQQVNTELEKLKVYGDSQKGGYLALLHGFIRIKRSAGDNRDVHEVNPKVWTD